MYVDDSNEHRYSASDWLQNIASLPKSTILKEIRAPILTFTAWSALVSVIHVLFDEHKVLCISSKPHSLLVSALGLLLVFRTNSAYQRFTEGRKIWEKLLSISRNMSRVVNLYAKELGEDRKNRIFRLMSAFPYLLRHHIQPQNLDRTPGNYDDPTIENQPEILFQPITSLPSSSSQLEIDRSRSTMYGRRNNVKKDDCSVDRRSLPRSLLPDASFEKCIASANRPLWICDRLSAEILSVPYAGDNYTSLERLALLNHVDRLSQCIGECERIHQTAVPLNYARHSLRSLTLWLASLPFCLLKDVGPWCTVPVTAAISWVLLGVYQIGYTIEDPFQGSLRLSLLCDAVYRDVMSMMNDGMRNSAFLINNNGEGWNDDEDEALAAGDR